MTATAPLPDLDGLPALVTGSSRGIGRAIALELARCRARVVVNYIENRHEAESVQREIEDAGGTAAVVHADVTDRAAVERMISAAAERFGPLAILVNNAGIARDRTLRKMSYEEWDEVLRVNLTGAFNCTRAVVPQMIERKGGRIVNVSSIVAAAGAFGQANYAAAKAGLLGFTHASALELARHGITVNAVCPGYTETAMLASVPENVRAEILARIPLARFARPEEIAACVRFLVTEGQYITGQTLHVNGGLYF